MKKTDFPQFDFQSLKHARQIEVRHADGRVIVYDVCNYWDTTADVVDVVECKDPSEPIDAPDDQRLPIIWIPSPDVLSACPVGELLPKPNHASHPELLLSFPKICDVFNKPMRKFIVD